MKTTQRLRPDSPETAFQTKEGFVAEYLRAAIVSGRCPRGTRLKQAGIAAELGMSITPVREAIKLLAAEGYVVGTSHRGAVVAPFDPAGVAETVRLRALIEPALASEALGRMTLGEMQELQRLAQDHDRAATGTDPQAAHDANYRFHRFLYGLAAAPLSLQFTQVLWARYPFEVVSRLPGRPARAVREHAEIMDAIVSRNDEAAAAATRRHILAGWAELEAALAASGSSAEANAKPP